MKIPLSPEEEELKAKEEEMEKKKKKQAKAKGKKKKKVLSEREQFEKDNPKNGPTDTVLKIQEQI